MATITWDEIGSRRFELGTDHGVIYPLDNSGVYSRGIAWNGLTGVTQSPSGAEPQNMYADNMKYASMRAAETFAATITAYTYPDEFAILDGTAALVKGVNMGQQKRGKFGLSYRTNVGNDINDSLGYKIHLVYGLTASPSEKSYQTINESPQAITFSWSCSSDPVPVKGYKPASIITIDSTKLDQNKLMLLESIIYGTDTTEPRLPLPDELAQIVGAEVPGATLGVLTVNATTIQSGKTTLTVSGAPSGTTIVTKVTSQYQKPAMAIDVVCDAANGWVDLPVNKQITATAGQVVTVAAVDSAKKAKAAGEATLS